MALKKNITLDNGITVNYHRIVSINKITNNSNIVEIASYTSEDKRKEEQEAIQNGERMNVFIHTTYINKEYNESETIEDIYAYLKTTEYLKMQKMFRRNSKWI